MIYKLHRAPEYLEWLGEQRFKDRFQVIERLSKIEKEGHFGDHKTVSEDDTVWELRWKNGRRVYYSYLPEQNLLILLGGNKNGQSKDITKAKNIYKKRLKEYS